MSASTEISFILSGTGTSHGIPVIGCHCPVCKSANPKNHRLRSGLIIKTPRGNIQVDTSPDLRQQLLTHKIEMINAVLFTHSHADHIYGLDDLRIFCHQLDHALPLFGEPPVGQRLREAFPYAFVEPKPDAIGGGVPKLEFINITTEPFDLFGIKIIPIRLLHGTLPILGFRIGNFAFCTDVSHIPEESFPLLENLDVLILDALRYREHSTHFSIAQAKQVALQLKASQTYLTHFCHDVDHEIISEQLPPHIQPAFDGLTLQISL